jgi:hypothetical protein
VSGLPDDRKPDVARQQVMGAVRHIDDAHHPENEGQPSGEEEQQGSVRDAIEDLSDPKFHLERLRRSATTTVSPTDRCAPGTSEATPP